MFNKEKEITISIFGQKIHLDAGGATIPQMVKVVNELIHNLKRFNPPRAKLDFDENNQMVVIASGEGEMPLSAQRGGNAATMIINLADGHVVGADIQHGSQSRGHVLNCLEFLSIKYSKRLVEIAKDLLGDDEEAQGVWLERVVNENKI